jgi:hypothetical protein
MQCLKIIRIENGSLQDLVSTFISMVGRRRLPGSSIVLMLQVGHLSNVGLESYVGDHLAAEQKIRSRFGKETMVGLLPPLLLAGSTSPATIRALHELLVWSEDYYQGADSYLDDTFAAAVAALKNSGEWQQLNIEIRRTRLPSYHKNEGEWKVWSSGGTLLCDAAHAKVLPTSIKPATVVVETNIITCLLQELRTRLALDLDPNPTFERGLGLQSKIKQSVD